MSGGMDVVARGARIERLGREFRWPGDRRVAVVFNVAYEAWSDGKPPGLSPMGNPLPPGAFDSNALSWGSYGSERGIERLMDVLARTRIRASVMTSGILAQRFPETVRAIAAAGHEIVAHSWAQDIIPSTLTPGQVRADIARTTEILAKVAGVRPCGWISPRGTAAADSARFVVEAGYAWQGDAFDDDRPYLQTFENGNRIVAIPLTMEINDLPHAMRFGRSPRAFIELFDDLLGHSRKNKREAVMIDVTAHAHVYGRPNGAWAYEEIAIKTKKMKDVWIATREQIATHVLKAAKQEKS
jgi:peptidoglycan/xylan/chitin deacetylase (PgdA/CDA1 family)